MSQQQASLQESKKSHKSALKSSSSIRPPETTSSSRKNVTFADESGSKLESIHDSNEGSSTDEEISTIVKNAKWLRDQIVNKSSDTCLIRIPTPEQLHLVPQFCSRRPGDQEFIQIVRQRGLCLERVEVEGSRVRGIVRVDNKGYRKIVTVVYTTNEWMSLSECRAEYSNVPVNAGTERFCFELDFPSLRAGEKVIFVVKYEVGGSVYWDNNDGRNYAILCHD